MTEYFLEFADCDVQADDNCFTNLDQARDVAFDISAETNRRINIIGTSGIYGSVIESILA
jgi:hypothetical protein